MPDVLTHWCGSCGREMLFEISKTETVGTGKKALRVAYASCSRCGGTGSFPAPAVAPSAVEQEEVSDE